ncbi:MAG: hypothetical protein KDA05_03695 [Phycisphaerales bacterium]|nr:hypothetical protein [Phycisphaerales bacterium]
MPIPGTILLGLLSSGVRAISGAIAPDRAPPHGTTDFQALLREARNGTVETGLPVTVARGVDIELSDEQLERLARAADRAQSAGATRALVAIDGRLLELDVATRQITAEHAPADADAQAPANAAVIVGIDGVVDAGDRRAGTRAANADGPAPDAPPTSGWNRSLLDALGGRGTLAEREQPA